jgi:hypothetical protein
MRDYSKALDLRKLSNDFRHRMPAGAGHVGSNRPIPEIRSRFYQPETGHSLSLRRQRMVSWRSDPGSILS